MMEDWQMSVFSEVLEIVSGKNQKEVTNENGKFPIYGSGGIMGRANEFRCLPRTTIIGRKGTINSPIYVQKKFWNVDTAFGLSPFSILNKKLLYYFAVLFNFKKLDKSTTIPSLAKRDLLKIKFPLPPLPIQRAIVSNIESLFSSLDSGISDLKKEQEQLKIYRQAVLKKAFEGAKEFVELKELAHITGGVTKGRKLEGKKTTELPYLRVANVQDGYLDLSLVKMITVLETDLDKYKLEFEDILFTEGGDRDKLGRGTVWRNEVENCIHQNHIFRARVNSKIVLNPYFLTYFAQSSFGKDYFFKHGKHTTNLASINKTILSSLPIPKFKPEQQLLIIKEIESRLSVCDKVEEDIKDSLEKAKALRQSILKKAFEGKLLTATEIERCKQEADYEPASVLLARIERSRNERVKKEKKK